MSRVTSWLCRRLAPMLLLGGLILLPAMAAPAAAQPTDGRLSLIYSGNLDGELEPCGCTAEGDFGGIRRRATALATLRKHDGDERPVVYTRRQLERAATHDALWNATQKEMLIRGKIHGYYRMYWGKKIIEWSRTHQEALRTMIEIHDRHALDGRDPNTYTNILWCFGLHDRPWFERPIFGQIRYMSYEGMKRKTNVDAYIREIEDLEKPTQGRLPL